MSQNINDPEFRVQLEEEAERRRAIETIEHFDHSLLDAIRRYDVKAIARIINRSQGKHVAGAVVLSVLLANVYIFHRYGDLPATLWSAIKLGIGSFISILFPLGLYFIVVWLTSSNPYYGDDDDVRMSTRIRGFLLILCACFGISALFVFGILA